MQVNTREFKNVRSVLIIVIVNVTAINQTKRLGRILLLSISANELKVHQTIDTAAILDLKWCHNRINDKILLGAANAAKTLEIYTLDDETKLLNFVANYTFNNSNEDQLLLSMDWSTGKHSDATPQIVVSDSKGNVNLFHLLENELILLKSWHAHEHESWIAAFNYWDTNIIFSGGDDSVLLKFDVRTGTKPIFKNKSHEAGVTCFHSNAEKEFIAVSGRY